MFYGADKPICPNPGPNPSRDHFEGPEIFKKAYRHVVDRVRARGATTSSGFSTS